MPQPTILEPARPIPVAGVYDVLVAGGGIAGVAAAVAARRLGASVCLLEKESALGGLATLGNVTTWLPLCDGRGRQVSGGLAEELLRLSVRDLARNDVAACFLRVPACWEPGGNPANRARDRFQTEFNPAAYLLDLEKWVVDAGVNLLYDTRLCAIRRDADRITHAFVENKSGRQAVDASVFVDATGDADVCHLAGETTASLDSNVACGWFYFLRDGRLHRRQCTNAYSPNLTREGSVGPFFRGDDGRQVTDQILASRELVRQQLAALRARLPNADVEPFAPTTIACFRATRRLVSDFELREAQAHEWFEDAIGLTGDWRKPGPVWALPLRCLRAVENRNLLVAGRCISVATDVWDVTRAIPGCVVTGEAAGAAAALAVREARADVHALPAARVQAELRARGVLLDPALVKPAAP
jgi:glycine/D-amino acid oxidase-like deaminating enzyme